MPVNKWTKYPFERWYQQHRQPFKWFSRWRRFVWKMETTSRITSMGIWFYESLKGTMLSSGSTRSRIIWNLAIYELSNEIANIFDHRPSRLALRREIEITSWQSKQQFAYYCHDNIILANRAPIDEKEIVVYLIDGIQNQASVQMFSTKMFRTREKAIIYASL